MCVTYIRHLYGNRDTTGAGMTGPNHICREISFYVYLCVSYVVQKEKAILSNDLSCLFITIVYCFVTDVAIVPPEVRITSW
jgi:hypothetical protein